MSVAFNAATAANVSMLQQTNALFQTAQKRVSTGKMIFGAADDATRYRMSDTMKNRAKSLDSINNNISLALKTLATTDKTLSSMISLVNSAQDLTRKAQSEGAAATRSAQTTSNIGSATAVGGLVTGNAYTFSITSDSGQNFTYNWTQTAAGITWGTITDALNSANIGVQATFEPSTTAGQTNLKFTSTNGKDFRFDGKSTETVMDDLVGLGTGSGGTTTLTAANAAFYFANTGATAATTETGFTVSYGGASLGTTAVLGTTAIATGSSLVFVDGNGQTKTYSNSATGTNLTNVMSEFNAQFQASGVVMELANTSGTAATTFLRIRNTNGGDMQLLAGTGGFVSGGAAGLPTVPTTGYASPLSTNNSLRLQYGVQYDALITNLNLLITNNPVQNGRNLLKGENLGVVMDEFAGNPVTVVGQNLSSAAAATNAALGLNNGGTAWTSDANIQTSATQTNTALTLIRNLQAKLATFNSYMQSRYDINSSYGSDMQVLGDDLVAADVAEESAKLTALQTQQQFAVQAFSAGTQNAQGLLRLLQ
jgi:flagellin